MGRGKNLDRLREFDDDILCEIVREGEARLNAQFVAATAADQRALTWAGFVITLTTATAGASITLVLSGKYVPIAVIGSLFSCMMGVSAFLAIKPVRPRPFCLPGNLPENWLPGEWEADRKRDLQQARIEQARCLNNQIDDNAEWARDSATHLAESMYVAAISLLLAVVYAAAFVIYKVTSA